jgi:hypothetical protein
MQDMTVTQRWRFILWFVCRVIQRSLADVNINFPREIYKWQFCLSLERKCIRVLAPSKSSGGFLFPSPRADITIRRFVIKEKI